MSYSELIAEHIRLAILQVLEQDAQYAHNETVLQAALSAVGHGVSADRLRSELAWLAEQGLLAVSDVGGLQVAKLTARGGDAAPGPDERAGGGAASAGGLTWRCGPPRSTVSPSRRAKRCTPGCGIVASPRRKRPGARTPCSRIWGCRNASRTSRSTATTCGCARSARSCGSRGRSRSNGSRIWARRPAGISATWSPRCCGRWPSRSP